MSESSSSPRSTDDDSESVNWKKRALEAEAELCQLKKRFSTHVPEHQPLLPSNSPTVSLVSSQSPTSAIALQGNLPNEWRRIANANFLDEHGVNFPHVISDDGIWRVEKRNKKQTKIDLILFDTVAGERVDERALGVDPEEGLAFQLDFVCGRRRTALSGDRGQPGCVWSDGASRPLCQSKQNSGNSKLIGHMRCGHIQFSIDSFCFLTSQLPGASKKDAG